MIPNMNDSKGEKLANVREIARRANVSIATVDRVLHNRTGVSEKTKKKIQEIIKELNYQPNILASRLASRKIYNLAILIPKVSEETDYWAAPLQGINRAESEINRYGITIAKYFFDLNDKMSFVKASEKLLAQKVDGLLVAPSFTNESVTLAKSCKKRQIPFVFINSDIPDQETLCYIGPHLVKSGYLAAHLMNYGMGSTDKILIVNISRELDAYHHLLRKEEGFRNYFQQHQLSNEIIKLDSRETGFADVANSLDDVFTTHADVKAIFTTNSRVSMVAQYLEEKGRTDLLLIGYDFLEKNINYLKKEVINFLICQKPEEQAYRGIMALHQHLVLSASVNKKQYMPIDIITKENYEFYSN